MSLPFVPFPHGNDKVFRMLVLSLIFLLVIQGVNPALSHAQSNLSSLLKSTWVGYKAHFIQSDGRVRDPNAENISTSEGQSYAMLRAVWMNDRETFDRVYQWSINNLQAPRSDKLFAWRWGKLPNAEATTILNPKAIINSEEKTPTLLVKTVPQLESVDGTWGVLNQESASDADQDIALALILAARIWKEPQYQTDALAILHDFWNKNTGASPAGRVLFAGDWHKNDITAELINPSYFAPYAYRIFAEVDTNPEHHWLELVDSSYYILNQATDQTRTGLPPNWLLFSLEPDKKISLFYQTSDQRSDYGYDAIRVHWRIGMDHLLTPNNPRALAFLKKSNFLERYWALKNRLPETLTVDGIERNNKVKSPSLSTYGASLLGLTLTNKVTANAIIDQQLLPSLHQEAFWGDKKDYYAQNWVWFGLAAHDYYQKTRYAKPIQRLNSQPKQKTLDALIRLIQAI